MKPQRGFLPRGCSGFCPLGCVVLGEFRLSERKVNGEERPQPFLQESWQIWAGKIQFMQSEYILGGNEC